MIANRQSLQDLIEPILPDIKIKMEQQYIFFCKSSGNFVCSFHMSLRRVFAVSVADVCDAKLP